MTDSGSEPFGHWLAGFIDGEGSFVISRHKRGAYRCHLAIHLRQDDASVLGEIVDWTGAGRVYLYGKRDDGKQEARAIWRVGSYGDCAHMVSLLDRYPLRAKKRRDYAIWREAVRVWATAKPGPPGSPATWVRMAALKRQLEAIRAFESVDVEMPELPEQFELAVGL